MTTPRRSRGPSRARRPARREAPRSRRSIRERNRRPAIFGAGFLVVLALFVGSKLLKKTTRGERTTDGTPELVERPAPQPLPPVGERAERALPVEASDRAAAFTAARLAEVTGGSYEGEETWTKVVAYDGLQLTYAFESPDVRVGTVLIRTSSASAAARHFEETRTGLHAMPEFAPVDPDEVGFTFDHPIYTTVAKRDGARHACISLHQLGETMLAVTIVSGDLTDAQWKRCIEPQLERAQQWQP